MAKSENSFCILRCRCEEIFLFFFRSILDARFLSISLNFGFLLIFGKLFLVLRFENNVHVLRQKLSTAFWIFMHDFSPGSELDHFGVTSIFVSIFHLFTSRFFFRVQVFNLLGSLCVWFRRFSSVKLNTINLQFSPKFTWTGR